MLKAPGPGLSARLQETSSLLPKPVHLVHVFGLLLPSQSPHPLSDITAGPTSSSRGGGRGERVVDSITFKEPQLMFGEKEAGIIGSLGSVFQIFLMLLSSADPSLIMNNGEPDHGQIA